MKIKPEGEEELGRGGTGPRSAAGIDHAGDIAGLSGIVTLAIDNGIGVEVVLRKANIRRHGKNTDNFGGSTPLGRRKLSL